MAWCGAFRTARSAAWAPSKSRRACFAASRLFQVRISPRIRSAWRGKPGLPLRLLRRCLLHSCFLHWRLQQLCWVVRCTGTGAFFRWASVFRTGELCSMGELCQDGQDSSGRELTPCATKRIAINRRRNRDERNRRAADNSGKNGKRSQLY